MISCEQFDYIEIACLYKMPVIVHLKDGCSISGLAENTLSNNKQEFMILSKDGESLQIETKQIQSLQATIDNPHFTEIYFE